VSGSKGWVLVDGFRDLEAFLDGSHDDHSALRGEIQEALERNRRPPGGIWLQWRP
jgi:hypothetical protein